jgi:hypothetical protein
MRSAHCPGRATTPIQTQKQKKAAEAAFLIKTPQQN